MKITLIFMRLVTSVEQIRSIRFCLYLHYTVYFEGLLKRCDITLAISALGEFLSMKTNVGQCSVFPCLTRRTGKIQFQTLWPGGKKSCILGKCSKRSAVTQNEGTAFFAPFFALALLLMGSGQVTWELYGFLSSAEWSKFLLRALGLSCIKYVESDRF